MQSLRYIAFGIRGIGLRTRFFIIIIISLILAAVGINLVQNHFFKNQRLRLIDRQIEESSSILLKSNAFLKALNNPAAIEESITKVLASARIGKVFVLRDGSGNIVYQSFNVGLLKADLPTTPDWIMVESEDMFTRIKNVSVLGRKKYVLQVGLVLNQNFLNWEIVDSKVVMYVSGIVMTLFIIAAVLTLILLSPIRNLNAHLKDATSNLTNMKDVKSLPRGLLSYSKVYRVAADEFSGLLSTIQKLIDRINLNYKLTRSWTSQMAHELKTPLAIIKLEVDSAKNKSEISEKLKSDILDEVAHMSDIISQFLDWAELESSHKQKDLHAIRIKSSLLNAAARLEKIFPNRIYMSLESDFSVVVNPNHLDQVITNLLSNALKFSPDTLKVQASLSENRLIVKDFGLGFPKEVLERLGQPFNLGTSKASGNGLGLALVSTVVKTYQWEMSIDSSESGSEVNIVFPTEELSEDF